MALDHLAPGEIADIRPFGPLLADAVSAALFKSPEMEVMRLVLRADQRIPEHMAPGDMTIQCLEGEVEVRAGGGGKPVGAGQLMRLERGTRYEIRAGKDSSLLVTISMPPEPNTA